MTVIKGLSKIPSVMIKIKIDRAVSSICLSISIELEQVRPHCTALHYRDSCHHSTCFCRTKKLGTWKVESTWKSPNISLPVAEVLESQRSHSLESAIDDVSQALGTRQPRHADKQGVYGDSVRGTTGLRQDVAGHF